MDALTKYEIRDGVPGWYAEDDKTDYQIVTEAIEAHLAAFVHDDDVAECAIYADAAQLAGEHIKALEDRARAFMERTGTCALCGQAAHPQDCPLYTECRECGAGDGSYGGLCAACYAHEVAGRDYDSSYGP